jgi:hypothetical protein
MKINMIQEAIIKGDEAKTQQRQFDLESQKYLIAKLTEKITKTVKSEVEARYKADMDVKIFSQRLSDKFESSLDVLRKETEEIINQTRLEIQNTSRECSERTHNVSKYIDQQINDAIFNRGGSMEELKNFVKKLTEQLKSSLISITKKHEYIEGKIANIENLNTQYKTDNKKYIDLVEERLLKKMRDVKLFTEINITRHDQFLESSIKASTGKIENNIKYLAGQLIDTRVKINERFEKIFEEHHDRFRKICEDMDQICKRIYKYEYLLEKYEQNYKDLSTKVDKNIADMYARHDIQNVQEKIIRTIECNFLQEQMNNLYNGLQTCNTQFNNNINEVNRKMQENFQFLNNQLEAQQQQMLEIAEKNLQMYENLQRSQGDMEVNQVVHEMVSKVDNQLLMESLQKSKNAEYDMLRQLQEHKNNIINSIDEINNNKGEINSLNGYVNKVENNLGGQINQLRDESKEMEMKEGVNKVMDLMLNNIENIMAKERMESIGKNGNDNLKEALADLERKFNAEIQQLKANTAAGNQNNQNCDDIKLATIQMLNNVEFENIYSILKNNNLAMGNVQTEPNEKNYREMVDNKINSALEKMKNDNENMWMNSVQMKNRVSDPEEIKKIINSIPPGVRNYNESLKELNNMESYEEEAYIPKVNDFNNINQNNYANYYNNNQKDPGPDIVSKHSSNKGSKKSSKNTGQKSIHDEIKSKNSKRSGSIQEKQEENIEENKQENEEEENKQENGKDENIEENKIENRSNGTNKNNLEIKSQNKKSGSKQSQNKQSENQKSEGKISGSKKSGNKISESKKSGSKKSENKSERNNNYNNQNMEEENKSNASKNEGEKKNGNEDSENEENKKEEEDKEEENKESKHEEEEEEGEDEEKPDISEVEKTSLKGALKQENETSGKSLKGIKK